MGNPGAGIGNQAPTSKCSALICISLLWGVAQVYTYAKFFLYMFFLFTVTSLFYKI